MPYYRRHLDDREVHRRWMDPRLRTVRLAQLRAYMLGKEWKEVPADSPGVVVFQEPASSEEGPLYQWFPDNEQRRDYVQGLYELLAALAVIEDRSAIEVLSDVLDQAGDDAGTNGASASAQAQPSFR